MVKIQFGTVLRKMRKSADMSQEELALDLHIARSSISKLERDQLELKAADLIRWANATQSQELVAAMILGIDVGLLQQALEMITSTASLVGMIFIGGI